MFCRQCASTLECPNCSVSLTVHRAAGTGAVPLLQLFDAAFRRCARNCAGPYLEQIGFGTERVEAEIHTRFPDARIARVDRDTIRQAWRDRRAALPVRAPARSTCSSARR